ncbi:MAG: hypothetical protein HGA37_01460 [Lentimicrobium sp.]|nr:hypothetical protein [Lentimicrobium sp.]
MEKFRNKYRIGSSRLKEYDYGKAGVYYITTMTKKRENYFGEIKNKVFYPSELGTVVESEWLKTPSVRQDMNIDLDEYITMPNHFHGILIIGMNDYNYFPELENHFAPQSKNLASIMRGFKSAVTTYARVNKIVFDWQERFHEHIIRDSKDLERIRDYVRKNPAKWDEGN